MRPRTANSWGPAQGSVLGSTDVQKWGAMVPSLLPEPHSETPVGAARAP